MENNGKKLGWSRVALINSLAAGVFGALYLTNDTFIMHQVIVCQDKTTALSAYLILGGWIGTICYLIYNAILGKRLDGDYPGFNLGTRKMQLFAGISGFIAAVSTAFSLSGNQNLDPSLIITLGNLSLFYLVIYDVIRKTISFKDIWFSCLVVIGGSILASITQLAGRFEMTLVGIFIKN